MFFFPASHVSFRRGYTDQQLHQDSPTSARLANSSRSNKLSTWLAVTSIPWWIQSSKNDQTEAANSSNFDPLVYWIRDTSSGKNLGNTATMQLLPEPHFDQGCWTDFQPWRQYCKVDLLLGLRTNPSKTFKKKNGRKKSAVAVAPTSTAKQLLVSGDTKKPQEARKTVWSYKVLKGTTASGTADLFLSRRCEQVARSIFSTFRLLTCTQLDSV